MQTSVPLISKEDGISNGHPSTKFHAFYLHTGRALGMAAFFIFLAGAIGLIVTTPPCGNSSSSYQHVTGAEAEYDRRAADRCARSRSSRRTLWNELTDLPIWLKLLVGGPALVFFLIFAARLIIYGFDRRPDFVISADGVFGLDGTTYREFKWDEISAISKVHTHRRTIFGREKEMGWMLIYKSRFPRKFSYGGLFGSIYLQVAVSPVFLEHEREKIVQLTAQYAPDIPINQKNQPSFGRGRGF